MSSERPEFKPIEIAPARRVWPYAVIGAVVAAALLFVARRNYAAAEAVRVLRDRCQKIGAPLRSPVDPSTRGFLIVWVLHANDAPPVTFLAGETAPATAEAINDAFLRGVQAVRPLTPQPLPRGEVHAERSP